MHQNPNLIPTLDPDLKLDPDPDINPLHNPNLNPDPDPVKSNPESNINPKIEITQCTIYFGYEEFSYQGKGGSDKRGSTVLMCQIGC